MPVVGPCFDNGRIHVCNVLTRFFRTFIRRSSTSGCLLLITRDALPVFNKEALQNLFLTVVWKNSHAEIPKKRSIRKFLFSKVASFIAKTLRFKYSRVPNNGHPPPPTFPQLLIFENFSNPPDFILTHLLLISKTFTIHKTKSNPRTHRLFGTLE